MSGGLAEKPRLLNSRTRLCARITGIVVPLAVCGFKDGYLTASPWPQDYVDVCPEGHVQVLFDDDGRLKPASHSSDDVFVSVADLEGPLAPYYDPD